MFQVKVPAWGASAKPSFKAESSTSDSKKRPGSTDHASPVPQSKRPKLQETNDTSIHKSSPSSKDAKQEKKLAKLSKPLPAVKPSSSDRSVPEFGSSPSLKGKVVVSGHGSSHPSKQQPSKSNKHQSPHHASSSGRQSIPKQKQQSKKAKKHVDRTSSDDSLDELFGSYGKDDGSEFSFTSDEDGPEIVMDKKKQEAEALSSDGFSDSDDAGSEESGDESSSDDHRPQTSHPRLSALQEQMRAKLEGGRFRFINEELYSTTGAQSFKEFQKDPTLFDVYHQGYRNQVQKWPENPLDIIVGYLKKQSKNLVVADFGCGEAKLAQTVPQKNVHSFDLVAHNKYITACDIAHTPLKDSSVDVAVFCLSLMGTNVQDFLTEAYRVLKPSGILKIAEVKSRFDNISKFTESLTKLGFDVKKKDESNKMFVLIDCTKSASRAPVKATKVSLKPCIYKRR